MIRETVIAHWFLFSWLKAQKNKLFFIKSSFHWKYKSPEDNERRIDLQMVLRTKLWFLNSYFLIFIRY